MSKTAGANVRRGAAFVLMSLLTLPLASCSSGDDTAKASATDNVAVAAKERVASFLKPVENIKLDMPALSKAPDLQGKKVLVVPVASSIFSTYVDGVTDALKRVGAVPQVCDGQLSPSTATTCFNQAKSIGAAGVISIGNNYQLMPNAFDDLAAAKIPVMAATTSPDGKEPTDYLAFQPVVDSQTAAMTAAQDYILSKAGSHANILMLGISDVPVQLKLAQAGKKYLQEKCPGCTIDLKNVASTQTDQVASLVSSAVLKNPGLNWIYPVNVEVSGPQVNTGLQSAGKISAVSQGGTGSGLGGAQLVEKKQAMFTAQTSVNVLAWNAVDGLLRLLDHQPVPDKYPYAVRVVDASNIGSLTLDAKSATGFDWFGEPTYQDEYLKLWHVAE
ncbi:sugar ABC transporter substrate-binding protein [Nonomuraea sp. NPDC050783]|uniref:sugar ABC transporter substrate-binding protein n=1 Tax=Nonomuraea sp. NPDC050783 TaxID=3154634 RepID=UPI0034672F3F